MRGGVSAKWEGVRSPPATSAGAGLQNSNRILPSSFFSSRLQRLSNNKLLPVKLKLQKVVNRASDSPLWLVCLLFVFTCQPNPIEI